MRKQVITFSGTPEQLELFVAGLSGVLSEQAKAPTWAADSEGIAQFNIALPAGVDATLNINELRYA